MCAVQDVSGSRARLPCVPPRNPLGHTLDGHVVELGAVALRDPNNNTAVAESGNANLLDWMDRNPWDEHAERYRELVAEREHQDPEANPVVSRMLALLGDLGGRTVLDACCGEGFFSRILAGRGARVTGID